LIKRQRNSEKDQRDIVKTIEYWKKNHRLKTVLEDKPKITQLVKLVKKSTKDIIGNKENLDAHYWRFWIMVADLIKADIINKKQYSEYFWKRLSHNLCYAISNHLEV